MLLLFFPEPTFFQPVELVSRMLLSLFVLPELKFRVFAEVMLIVVAAGLCLRNYLMKSAGALPMATRSGLICHSWQYWFVVARTCYYL